MAMPAFGAAMLATTYALGELSALNGVMGAKAERSLVYHFVGMPSYQNQRLRKIMHHTFGDGDHGVAAGRLSGNVDEVPKIPDAFGAQKLGLKDNIWRFYQGYGHD